MNRARGAQSSRFSAGSDHVDLDGGHDVGVQAHGDGVAANGLDRGDGLDLAAVDGGATGVLNGLGQLGGGDCAKEAAVGASGGGHGDHVVHQPGAGGLRLLQGGDGAPATGLGHLVDLPLGALGPRRGELAGQQVVTGVTVLDLDDLTGLAKVVDVVGEDELGGHASSFSASGARVGQQGHLAGVLHGLGDLALLLHGDAGDATGTDLAAVGDELAQRSGVLVVDLADLNGLDRADLLLWLTKLRLRHGGTPCFERLVLAALTRD